MAVWSCSTGVFEKSPYLGEKSVGYDGICCGGCLGWRAISNNNIYLACRISSLFRAVMTVS